MDFLIWREDVFLKRALTCPYSVIVLRQDRSLDALERLDRTLQLGDQIFLSRWDLGLWITPPPWNVQWSKSNAAKCANLSALARAINIANYLWDNAWNDNYWFSSNDLRYESTCTCTTSTSCVNWYFEAGGQLLNKPFRKCETSGCWPTCVPSTSLCIKIADLVVFHGMILFSPLELLE